MAMFMMGFSRNLRREKEIPGAQHVILRVHFVLSGSKSQFKDILIFIGYPINSSNPKGH